MILAQFGSKAARDWKPIWFDGLVDGRDQTGGSSKAAQVDLPWGDFVSDGYGAHRAPLEINAMDVQGQVYCSPRQTADEWIRDIRSRVGVKDWLMGYRGGGCKCGACGPYLRCCTVCGSEQSVQWFARQARLKQVSVTRNPQSQPRAALATVPVQMTFEPYSPWQLMSGDRWSWGVPNSLDAVPSDACNPPTINEMAWPCIFPACTLPPPSRFYRKRFTWIENYCVGYWSAGRWIRSSIGEADQQFTHGGEASIYVAGDTFPISRLAFTNFVRLELTVCSPTGFEYSFTVDEWCGEPQYLLISPYAPPQFRYCPLHDDECIHVVPTAEFAQIAQQGEPVAVDSQTTNILGRLWPGRNILRFQGMRMPGHPFQYSYDVIPTFL